MSEQDEHSRWEYYFMRKGIECSTFWKDYLAGHNRNVLFILGLGFDPRMCLGLRMLLKADPNCVKECLLVKYNEGTNSPSHEYHDLVSTNVKELGALMKTNENIREVDVPMLSEDGRRIGSRKASNVINDDLIRRADCGLRTALLRVGQ